MKVLGIVLFRSGSARALLLAAAVALSASAASANVVTGNLLGVFPGNDSEATLLADLGLVVNELAKVDVPDTSTDGLTISNIVLNGDSEPVSGQWDYLGVSVVDIFVVKAGNQYAAYEYNDFITSNMPNTGLWDTTDLGDDIGLSNVTAYELVPEPGASLLVALGLIGIAARRRGARRH
jgi:hypothetical protein